ncbi:MAG: GNAT family N-acetyltransferase [Chitinophagaceae bacterium]
MAYAKPRPNIVMITPDFQLQPTLQNEFVKIRPLAAEDFDTLYLVASDPLIWEQHPNKNRYQLEAFQNFFKGAMESGGAFLVFDTQTNETIGSSRFCDAEEDDPSCVAIGYTFLARDHWGSTYNQALKKLMIDHAFRFVDRVVFHIGAENRRSQNAIEKVGAKKVAEIEMEYYGEPSKLNFTYQIDKIAWQPNNTNSAIP